MNVRIYTLIRNSMHITWSQWQNRCRTASVVVTKVLFSRNENRRRTDKDPKDPKDLGAKTDQTISTCTPSCSLTTMRLPTHQQMARMFKGVFGQTFGENVSQLVLGIDLDKFNLIGFVLDFLTEPVILYCVVFRLRCHPTSLTYPRWGLPHYPHGCGHES